MDFDFEIGFKVLLALVFLGALAVALYWGTAEDEKRAWTQFGDIREARLADTTHRFECAASTNAVNAYADLLGADGKALSIDGPEAAVDANMDSAYRARRLAAAQSSMLEFRANLVSVIWMKSLSDADRSPFPWSDSPSPSDADLNLVVSRGLSPDAASHLSKAQMDVIRPLLSGVSFSAYSAAITNQLVQNFDRPAYDDVVAAWDLNLHADPFGDCGSFIRSMDYNARSLPLLPHIN